MATAGDPIPTPGAPIFPPDGGILCPGGPPHRIGAIPGIGRPGGSHCSSPISLTTEPLLDGPPELSELFEVPLFEGGFFVRLEPLEYERLRPVEEFINGCKLGNRQLEYRVHWYLYGKKAK